MKISIVIPAHNEEQFLADCLAAFVVQTQPPDELIVVDDNSTDNTFAIANDYAEKHYWITAVQRKSENRHLPGKKVIDTFNFGMHTEHHDFHYIPWFRLGRLRQIAPEYYDNLKETKSFCKLAFQFAFGTREAFNNEELRNLELLNRVET